MKDSVQIIADDFKVKLNSNIDHSSQVTFIVGEYMAEELSKLTRFIGKNVKVKIEEA